VSRHLKLAIQFTLCFLLANPVYSQNPASKQAITNVKVNPQTKSVNQTPQALVKTLIEAWNSTKKSNDLIPILGLPKKESSLLEKLIAELKLSNRKLPKAEFNEKKSIISIAKLKLQILSYNPLVLFIDGKPLNFDQQPKLEDKFDFILKEYTALTSKTVLFYFLLPQTFANSSSSSNYKPMLYLMGGGILALLAWGLWSSSSSGSTETSNSNSVASSLPKYKAFSDAVREKNTKISFLGCDSKTHLLKSLSVYNSKNEQYEFLFNSSKENNDVKELTVVPANDSESKNTCKFIVEDSIWKRLKGMPESCRAPSSNPFIPLDFAPIDEAKSCCKDKSGQCGQWVNNDLIDNLPVGSASSTLELESHDQK
jgi:hypothetical protein